MQVFKTQKGTELPLMDIKGKPYLQVPYRIVWFREVCPDWVMEVTYPTINSEFVMARAEIRDETGKVRAVAHKVEHFKHFLDAIEKSETSAIGRALGMLGYGTQFAPEFDEHERLADSPVEPVKEIKEQVSQTPIPASNLSSPKDTYKFNPNDHDGAMDPGLCVVRFGKYKGKLFKDIGLMELKKYIEWIKTNSSNTKKPIGRDAEKLIDDLFHYEKFLKSLENINLEINESEELPF